VEEIIPKSGAGVLVSEFTPLGYQTAITELCMAKFDPVKIRKFAEELFSLKNGVDKYDKVYQGCLAINRKT
jgi:hypothetical protein